MLSCTLSLVILLYIVYNIVTSTSLYEYHSLLVYLTNTFTSTVYTPNASWNNERFVVKNYVYRRMVTVFVLIKGAVVRPDDFIVCFVM